ncbi:MAG: HupE/UreJ family protein [Bacteroidetes bacterium]|nr:HupE/UreJ family protein [Bacteroidota bacterium]
MNNFTLFFDLGLRHILTGYDHLLFLLGLIMVTRNWRSLLSVATAFTIAHSTTLVLCALDVISIDPVITESLIALSIVYVGIENVVRREYRGRWMIAGLFGLIHGAGFSGHLTDLLKSMLGMGQIWAPLVGFNLGIEAGQLLVIGTAFPLLWLLRRYGKEREIVVEVSRVIACIGAVLIVARIWGLSS